MTPERWQQIKELFHSALEREPEQRPAFLAGACDADPSLRAEVESLIAAHELPGSFLDAPAYEVAAGMLADDQSELEAGRRIGHYQIIATLGEGGMGKVYLAEDSRLKRHVALKLLPASFLQDEERVRRFEQEARAASALNHPNILTIHEIGTEGDHTRFIATEFVEGVTLREHLKQAPLKLHEVLEIAIQTAAALSAAHAARIAHRDIKPENLMIRPDGYVKVLDFGLAKLTEPPPAAASDTDSLAVALVNTQPGMVMGTIVYMSPEQARGLEVDARTDIWSLGVVLYEMIAGEPPFRGSTNSDVMVSVLDREPPPLTKAAPGVSSELERIVTKALAKDREERYQTIKDMLIDLRRHKQRLEFEAEMSRSASRGEAENPHQSGALVVRQSSGAALPPTSSEQRKQVTVLFADLYGFTAISETLDAEEVNDHMNALWKLIDTAILDQGGMIDKHMGDTVMALWGTRAAHEDDPERAIRAALAMQAEAGEFISQHLDERLEPG
ncbi:MAG: protein kinase, partial [Pyrinomonadaceae bacterium]